MSGKAWRPYVRVGSSKREKRNFTAYLDQFREPYSPSPRRTGRRNKPKRKILKTMGQGKKAKPKEKDTSEKLVGDGSQVNSVPVNDSTSRPVLKTMGQDKKAKSKEKDTSEKLVVDGSQINSVPLDVSTSKTVVVIMDGVADISMRQGGIFKSNLDKLLSSNSVTVFRMNEFIDIYSKTEASMYIFISGFDTQVDTEKYLKRRCYGKFTGSCSEKNVTIVKTKWYFHCLDLRKLVPPVLSKSCLFEDASASDQIGDPILCEEDDSPKRKKRESVEGTELHPDAVINHIESKDFPRQEPEGLPFCVSWSLNRNTKFSESQKRRIKYAYTNRFKLACHRNSKSPVACTNEKIVKQLEELEGIYKIRGDGQWRAMGYRRAANIVKRMKMPLTASTIDLLQTKAYGIGSKLVTRMKDMIDNGGQSTLLKELKGDPKTASITELGQVWGIGPSTAHSLFQKFDIKSVTDLRAAAHSGRIKLTHGQSIGLKHFDDLKERVPREEVARIRDFVQLRAKEICAGVDVICTGSYRRGKNTCGDIDLLFCAHDFHTERNQVYFMKQLVMELKRCKFLVEDLTETFECSYMGVCKIPQQSNERNICRHIDLKVYSRRSYPFALLYFTGSDYFNRSMRHYANKIGWSLSDRDLVPVIRPEGKKGIKIKIGGGVPAVSEEDIFRALGLQFREPNERNCYGSVNEDDDDDEIDNPIPESPNISSAMHDV